MSSDNYLALELQSRGNEAMPGVLQLLRDSKLADLCYAYKIRTKPEAKLIEKVQRKRKDKPEYALKDITDVVGLRLVALFRAEMADLFEGILSAITHSNGVQPNPLCKGRPEEVIIYKGTNAFDDLPARLRDIANRVCPGLHVREEHSREGYSSVHLVTRLAVAAEHMPSKDYRLPIEIQIRSVFEDAWGEIDHKFGYVIRTGKDTGKPISNPEFVLAHLRVLKRFSDACMEYADAIHTEAIGVPPSLVAAKKVVSVASDEQILERFAVLGIPSDLIDSYRRARDIKDEAGKIMDGDLVEGKRRYINAAETFRELIESAEATSEEFRASAGGSLLYYYLRMNEAVCLMSTNERDQVVAALALYQGLEAIYQDYPLLKMRHGQALGKLGHLDEALTKLRESGEAAEKIAADSSVTKIWPDTLPKVDYEHLAGTQPKLLGYHVWLKLRSLGAGEDEQKSSLFREAYKVTLPGLEAVKDNPGLALSLHNNLLYYAIGVLSRARDGDDVSALKDSTLRHLNYIEKNGPALGTLKISTADTLMKAYAVLDRREEAVKAARVLMDRCLSENTSELDEKEALEVVRYAHHVANGGKVALVN